MSEQIQVPEGWELKKLSDVCKKITSGGTPSRGNSEYFGGEIPWLKSGELNDGIIYDSEEKITKSALENSSAKLFPKDTILFAMYGATIGKTGMLKKECATNQAICGMICGEKLISNYLLFFLQSRFYQIRKMAKGGAQPNINQNKLKNLQILLPPIPIQKKIVQKLDDILGRLEEKKKEISKLKEKIEQTISQLSQKTIGGLIINYMKLDNPPENWQLKTIEECVGIQPGFAQGQKNIQGGTIHLRMNNIGRNFQLNFDKVRTINATEDQLEKYRLEKGDVVFNNTNSTELVGKSFLFDDEQLCLYSNHLTRCRVKKDLILPEWLLFYIRGKWLRRDFERMCNKWINQAAVGSDKLKKLQIPIPTLSEQKQILKTLSSASEQFEQIANFEKTIKIRDIQNQTLLQKMQLSILDVAFSGKLVS